MKQLLMWSTVYSLVVLLAACSVLRTSLAPRVSAVITAYCQEPEAERQLLREEVAKQIAPNRIEIHCQ